MSSTKRLASREWAVNDDSPSKGQGGCFTELGLSLWNDWTEVTLFTGASSSWENRRCCKSSLIPLTFSEILSNFCSLGVAPNGKPLEQSSKANSTNYNENLLLARDENSLLWLSCIRYNVAMYTTELRNFAAWARWGSIARNLIIKSLVIIIIMHEIESGGRGTVLPFVLGIGRTVSWTLSQHVYAPFPSFYL